VPYNPQEALAEILIPNYRQKFILGNRMNCASPLRWFVPEYLLSGSKEDVVTYVSQQYGSSRESLEQVVNRLHEENSAPYSSAI
jgi:hypothetical protein